MYVYVYIFIHMIKEKKRNDFHDMYTKKRVEWVQLLVM